MKKLKLSLCAVGAYLVLIAAYGALATDTAAGQQPGAPGPDVRVINLPTQPVPVTGSLNIHDADNPARQPFQTYVGSNRSGSFHVPAGKRLVIEFISGHFLSTGNVAFANALTTAGGEFVSHEIMVTRQGATASGVGIYGFTGEVRLYADPGSQVSINSDAFIPGLTFTYATISGYLVDVN